MPAHKTDLRERFWSKVDKNGPKQPHMKTRCWVWIGGKFTSKPYGRLCVEGKTMQAHRLSFVLNKGVISKGMCVLHACDIPLCIRPSHLHEGTGVDNVRERVERGRSSTGDHVPFERRVRGARLHTAKLTADSVRQIRTCYARGRFTLKQLAKKYDVTFAVIHKAIKHVTWRHV